MARTQSVPGLNVFQIFNLCQKSITPHARCVKLLWQLEQANSESCFRYVLTCIKHVLLIPPGEVCGDRIVRFVASFLAGRDPNREAECDAFAEKLLRLLTNLVTARDKSVRIRCCQLVQVLFNGLTADELDEELLDSMEQTMMLRLEDKVPAVRAQAVKALPRLCNPGDDEDFADDPILEAYLQLLAVDKSKDVRKAVLVALPACETMVAELVARCRDVNEEVRRTAYAVLKDRVGITHLSVDQRAQLLWDGLRERAPSVQLNATQLVQSWLQDACDQDPIKLLKLLNVEVHEEVAVLVMKALIESAAIDPQAMAHVAAEQSQGLRQAPGQVPLSPAEALEWRVVCIHLHEAGQEKGQAAAALTGAPATAEAAAAEDHLKALEAALPPTTSEFMNLVAAHAAAGQEHSFATCQLLQLAATCVDMGDATGRQATAELVQQLLRDPSRPTGCRSSTAWDAALLQLAKHVYPSSAELADAMLGMLWDMYSSWGLNGEPQSPQEQDENMPGDTSANMSFQTVLDQASQVRSQNQHWAHTLRVAGLLIQQLPSARLHPGGAGQFRCVEDLWPLLILPGLGHTVAAVRLEAMRCLGLYCLLDGIPRPEGQMAALRAGLVWQQPQAAAGEAVAEAEEADIRAVAARALCDWALIKGPKASDQWYLNQAPMPQDLQQSPPSSPQQKLERNPLLDLLLSTLQQTLHAQRQSTSRSEKAGASDEDEDLGSVLAEGVAKVLLHARLWSPTSGKGLQEAEIARALAVLLVAHFDPATQDRPKLRQCLSVFFPTYAAASCMHRHHIARAFRRAARGALGVAPVKKAPVAQVMRFMLQLLQITPASASEEEAQEEDQSRHSANHKASYPGLAAELLSEITQCTRFKESKAYLTAIPKVLLALPLDGRNPAAIKQLRALTDQVSGLVKDRAAAKDLTAFAKQLEGLDATPQQGLDADALAQLMQSVSLHSNAASPPAQSSQAGTSQATDLAEHDPAQQSPLTGVFSEPGPSQGEASLQHDLLADCPLPFEEGAVGAAARTPARRPAKRWGVADDTSDTESREMVLSTAVRRQMPARSARTTRKLVEVVSSSSSESEAPSDGSEDVEIDI